MIQGIDVYHGQGNYDWNQSKAQGNQFGFVKATEGLSYVDPMFHSNWIRAQAAGFYIGAYHFFHSNVDPQAQAKHFVSTVGAKVHKQLPFVMDLEVTDGSSAREIVATALEFLNEVEELTGTVPMIYGSPGFISPLGFQSSITKYPLWVAEYGVSKPKPVKPWPSYAFWQYAGTGVDKNIFQGDLSALDKLAI